MGAVGKIVTVGVCVIALTFLVFGGYLWYSNWKVEIMKIPPKAPTDLTAKPMSAIQIKLTWRDNSNNENGFLLYRDDKKIAELSENAKSYVDTGLRPATSYRYEIKAYNQAGESDIALCLVKTSNPPIVVWIDKVGVHENGEEGELFREFSLLGEPGEGEVQVGLVVSDGNNVVQVRLPTKGFYKLKKDQAVQVNLPLFETKEIGNYLRIYAIAYEDDGGFGEQLIYKALDIATGSYINMPTSILLKLAGVDFAKIYAEIFGAEDDWLGSYISECNISSNWGVGNYVDIQCKRDNGNIGLRLWFRVLCPVYNYSSEKNPSQ